MKVESKGRTKSAYSLLDERRTDNHTVALKAVDAATLLFHAGLSKILFGELDTDETTLRLMDRFKFEVRVPRSSLEKALALAHMCYSEDRFAHPIAGGDFERFLKRVVPEGYEYNMDFNTLDRKKK